jgi:hypothetical protein
MKNLIRITIIGSLLTQISHASHVFYMISGKSDVDYIISWVFALALETSIFIFTMYGKMKTAVFFGIISWMINLLTYWFEWGFTQNFVAMNVISLIIPLSIFFYSELIKEELQENDLPVVDVKPENLEPTPEPEIKPKRVYKKRKRKYTKRKINNEPIKNTTNTKRTTKQPRSKV